MGDTVSGVKGRLGKVRVTEFDGVREQQGLGSVVHDVKTAVVVEVRALMLKPPRARKSQNLRVLGVSWMRNLHPRGPSRAAS